MLVVAQQLGMSQGKVAAQCAHAAVGLYRLLQQNRVPWKQAWEVSPLAQQLPMMSSLECIEGVIVGLQELLEARPWPGLVAYH